MSSLIVASNTADGIVVVKAPLCLDFAKDVGRAFTPLYRDDYPLHSALVETLGDTLFRWFTVDMSDRHCWVLSFTAAERPKVLRYRGAPTTFTHRATDHFKVYIHEVVDTLPWSRRQLVSSQRDTYVS